MARAAAPANGDDWHPSLTALAARDLSTDVVRLTEQRNPLSPLKLLQASQSKPHGHPRIPAAIGKLIIRRHTICPQWRTAPLPTADRLYRALRWTKPGGLPWLLAGLLVCTPLVRAQTAGSEQQATEVSGTLLLEGANRPKASHSSPARLKDSTVSVRELRIPEKAHNAFAKGLERLAKNDPANSRTEFVRAITAFPDYYEAYYHLGVANLWLGRDEEAAQAFQKAVDLSGGRYAWAQFALGLVLCRRGEYSEAEAVIRRGLDVDDSSAAGHHLLSTALLHLNRLGEAEENAREALLREPRLAVAYLVLADVHRRQGEYAIELHDLDAYLKLEPDGPESKGVREVRAAIEQILRRTKIRNDFPASRAGSGSGLMED